MGDLIGIGKLAEEANKFLEKVGLLDHVKMGLDILYAHKLYDKWLESLSKIVENSACSKEELEILSDKFKIIFIREASLEDDGSMQKIWSNLLRYSVKNSNEDYFYFIGIIKDLRPLDAKVFSAYLSNNNKEDSLLSILSMIDKSIGEEDIEVSLDNLIRLNLLATGQPIDIKEKVSINGMGWNRNQIHVTKLGYKFYDIVSLKIDK